MDERKVTHAMVATLPGDERIVGALMLANRLGVVRAFDAEDLKLFEALANNTSVALQFDRLEQSVWQLRELQEQLQHQAFHDPLTNLANRSLFVNQVKDALSRREGQVAVLFIDVDDFKTVNDTLGHAVGDELLMAISRRLRGCVLAGDTIARLGGDEFAILLQHVEDAAEAGKAVADRIVSTLNDPVSAGGRMSPVKVSIGIATGRPGLEHADEVIRNADVAMYHAKRGGKGRAAVFELSMRAAVLERHGLKSDLERALEREQLRVEYQPIFSLADDRMTAVEALVRWDRHDGGPVLPSEFVPLAEETGLIGALGEFVLAEACLQAKAWMDEGAFGGDVAVHVNVSAVELEDAKLVPRVADVLDQTGLPPRLLVLEVTESAVLRDAIRGTTTLTELQEIGVRLALDDFGTGYSSLSYLRTLPLDMLKVARPFIEEHHPRTPGSKLSAHDQRARLHPRPPGRRRRHRNHRPTPPRPLPRLRTRPRLPPRPTRTRHRTARPRIRGRPAGRVRRRRRARAGRLSSAAALRRRSAAEAAGRGTGAGERAKASWVATAPAVASTNATAVPAAR